ncbi:gliding motility-associated C-terminal domain-containing protein [Flavobacterium enshiense]|uniref:HYR-like domain-containing protein n=1 Tax=Flavobacterium enshiense TaxID=1341165 RepID=UPI00345DDE0C
MKPKITLLLLFLVIGINNVVSQTTGDHPDLRLCTGGQPYSYLDYFNCTSNNYTLDNVYLSASDVNGNPITEPCAVPSTQPVYIWLNYTSNSNSPITQVRIFSTLTVRDADGNIISDPNNPTEINTYLGSVYPGVGRRLLTINGSTNGFTWTCGTELSLTRTLVVWLPNGDADDPNDPNDSFDPELPVYNCRTYSTSQCEFSGDMIIKAPLAVQFEYTACTIGNQTTVTFDDDTNGGAEPYFYTWNFGDGSPVSHEQNPVHVYPYPGGPYTVTFTVTDSSVPTPMTHTVTQIISSTPITIAGVPHSASCSTGNNGSIDGVSASGGTPPYSYSWSNGANTPNITGLAPGNYTVTVTDAVGCTGTRTFTILPGDSGNPVVTAPNDLSIEGCGTVSIGGLGYLPFSSSATVITMQQFNTAGGSYSDTSSITTVTYQDVASGSCPVVVTRTFTLTDVCGNSGSDVQIISIDDTTPPVIATLPASSTINCPAVPEFAQATASDNCSAPVTLSFNDVTTPGQCAGSYSVTRTWTATDACGMTSTASQTITVQDVSAPVIDPLPAASTINCPAVPEFAQATASDNCGSAFTLTFNDVTTPGQCAGSYSVTRTWTATDACGMTSTASQTITVQDILPPVAPEGPEDIIVSCSSEVPAMPVLTAEDCSGPISVTGVDEFYVGECINSYTIIRKWIFQDACGNSSSTNQTITVHDETGPTYSPAIDLEITIDSCSEIPEPEALVFSDNCGGVVTVTYTEEIVNQSENQDEFSYDIIRTWTATDVCGNETVVIQTIHVNVSDYFDTRTPELCNNAPINANYDLNELLADIVNEDEYDGIWTIENPGYSQWLNGNILNVTQLPVGYYTLVYTLNANQSPCPRKLHFYIHVVDDCGVLACRSLEIFNAVSPNNDNLNDVFLIENITDPCYVEKNVQIYNRWGVLVYEANGYNNDDIAFRGKSTGRATFNGNEDLPDGTYFYILKFRDTDGWHDRSGYLYLNR